MSYQDHIVESLRKLAVPIGTLVLDPKNARKHDKRNIDAIKASLTQFGQHRPAVVQMAGMIVRAGNGMVQAARELGWTEIAAIVVDESDAQATARALADNRTAELAEWDSAVLDELLREVCSEIDIDAMGFGAIDGKETGVQELTACETIFKIMIECNNETQQAEWLEVLSGLGIPCKALML